LALPGLCRLANENPLTRHRFRIMLREIWKGHVSQ